MYVGIFRKTPLPVPGAFFFAAQECMQKPSPVQPCRLNIRTEEYIMKNLMLRILGRHIGADSDDDDRMEFVTESMASLRNGTIYVIYDEGGLSDLPEVRTTMRIDRSGSVRMKRSGKDGANSTVMEFEKGRRFHSLYHTPYGPLEMEVLTNRIVNDIDPDSLTGTLFIDYDIALRGLSETRTLLNMELYESKKQPLS